MKKLILIGITTLAALFAVVGLAPAAQAYPETSCNVSVDSQVVRSGGTFTATGESQQFTTPRLSSNQRTSAVEPVSWTMTFNGEVRKGKAVTFVQKFKAPVVKKKTTLPLTASAIMADAKTTCTKTVDITILPGGTTVSPPGENLPNTGGPQLYLLIAGLVLVVAGGLAIRSSRKSHEISRGAHSA